MKRPNSRVHQVSFPFLIVAISLWVISCSTDSKKNRRSTFTEKSPVSESPGTGTGDGTKEASKDPESQPPPETNWDRIESFTIVAKDGLEVDPAPITSNPDPVYITPGPTEFRHHTINVDPRTVDSQVYIRARQPTPRSRLAFTITEPSQVIRKRYPVRGALPFHRGELTDARSIKLFDDKSAEVTVQARPTAFWPEGSIKFLCLDFQITLGARQTRTFVLEYGTEVKATSASMLKTSESNGKVDVDTGKLKISFSAGPTFSSAVFVNGRPATRSPIQGNLVVSENGDLHATKDFPLTIDEVHLMESGPVQATIYLRGHYGEAKSRSSLVWQQGAWRFPFHGFVRLYDGSTRVDLSHTFGYNGDESKDFVRRYGLTFPADGTVFRYGGDGGTSAETELTGAVRLSQTAHNRWSLSLGNANAVKSGLRFGGWAGLINRKADSQSALTIALRDAWQQWPVSFAATPNGDLRIDIHGGEGDQFLDLRYMGDGFSVSALGPFIKSKSMYTGEAYSTAYGGDSTGLAAGLVKTSELVIDFGPDVDPEALGAAQNQFLFPWAGAARYAETRVLGLTGFYKKERSQEVQTRNYFSILMDHPWAAHLANGLFGWVDWPDSPDFERPSGGATFATSNFGGGNGWSNGERLNMGQIGHFLASGWRRALDLGHMTALHTIGIDTEHSGGEMPLGTSHRHHQAHWSSGGEARQGAWRAWYSLYWLTGNNEILRQLKEMHYFPLGMNAYSGTAIWPWHVSSPPEKIMAGGDKQFLCAADCSPYHYMNLLRWITTGEKQFVDHLELVMDVVRSNDTVNGEYGHGIPIGREVIVSQNRFDPPLPQFNHNPDSPVRPVYNVYRWATYGGDDLASEWAQLTGSAKATDIILHFGDYGAADGTPAADRIDMQTSPTRPAGIEEKQLYQAPEGIIPPYYLLRKTSHPARAARWKKAMSDRLFYYSWASPKVLTPGATPLLNPMEHTAMSYEATGVKPWGSNGPKITIAHGMEALYTLWLLDH